MRQCKLIQMLLSLAVIVTLMSGTSQAALLDVGPVVEQKLGSIEGVQGLGTPPLGHGYPLWYRDSNRVPLELCLDRLNGQCATFEPNPEAALQFPDPANGIVGNYTGEAFWWSADAFITTPGAIDASLGMALEAAFSTGDPVPNAQVSFARVRIRVSGLPNPGLHIVTTPYKQYQFTVVTDPKKIVTKSTSLKISALQKAAFSPACSMELSIPSCTATARLLLIVEVNTSPRPAGTCVAEMYGEALIPPRVSSSYEFRVQGPGVNIFASEFIIIGKVFAGEIPTPLAVDKATYALDSNGLQLNVHSTTQAMSNQTVVGGTTIPGKYALNNTPSALQVLAPIFLLSQ